MSNNSTGFFFIQPCPGWETTDEIGQHIMAELNMHGRDPFVGYDVAEARAYETDAGMSEESIARCDLYKITITKVGQTL